MQHIADCANAGSRYLTLKLRWKESALTRIRYLDGWRASAVLCVLVAHFGSGRGINLGRVGVELFFVLSGRLMAEILFKKETPLSSFFPRRFSRVYPALVTLVILLFATASWRSGDPTPAQFLAAATFTSNYAQFWIGKSPVLDHIWSLCIEEHMYILLGISAFIHRKMPFPLVPVFSFFVVIAISIGLWQTMQGYDYYTVYWRTDVRGASLLLGVIAYLAFNPQTTDEMAPSWKPIVFGILGILFSFNPVPDPIKYSIGTAFFALSVVLMPRAPRFFISILENSALLRVGILSYSIYLWQQPFAKLSGGFFLGTIHLMLAVIAGLLSFYLVEQPARGALNRLIATRRGRVREQVHS